MFNLRRRIEYSTGGLNFCQLAAIRLFLETGEVETDTGRVRRRHRETFAGSPEEGLWDYLMQTSPSHRDSLYPEGTRAVAAEYARVDELLAENRESFS